METYEAVRTVLAVRAFQEKSVPPETVRKIVEAGRLTGSSMNRQPWHFIVVTDREMLRRIGAAAKTGPYIAGAPLAVVVAIDKQSPYAVSDASRAIQSMILTAWADGIGSNWVGFMGLEAVRPLLGIPGTLDVLAVIPFGYGAERKAGAKKNRKPLGEVARRETFSRPFA